MRLLIVNPNTTVAVTERVATVARDIASPGTELSVATAEFGVAIVSTEAELAVAQHAAIDLLATHGPGHDAAIVAMSFDAGVVAGRRLLGIPVIGITAAALATAGMHARRIGLVIGGAVSLPMYLDLIDAAGMGNRIVGIEVAEIGDAAGYLDAGGLAARYRAAALVLAARPEVEAIILCGAAAAGLATILQPAVGVPLIDGVAAAVAQADAAVRLGLSPRRPPPALSRGREPRGLSSALHRMLRDSA